MAASNKSKQLLAAIAFSTVCSSAFSAGSCPTATGQYLDGSTIQSLVGGKTVCAQSASGGWNEYHAASSGGAVGEWHTNTTADPKEDGIATYTVTSFGSNGKDPGTITYSYASGSYTYYVTKADNQGNNVFCTAMNGTGITVNVRSGYLAISGCPSNPNK